MQKQNTKKQSKKYIYLKKTLVEINNKFQDAVCSTRHYRAGTDWHMFQTTNRRKRKMPATTNEAYFRSGATTDVAAFGRNLTERATSRGGGAPDHMREWTQIPGWNGRE